MVVRQRLHCSCCCLPTPMTLARAGIPIFPLVVHQPASPSIWPAVHSQRRDLSTYPGMIMWCVCGCSWRDVCRVCAWYRSGDWCVLASTLCVYTLKKGDLFVLRCAKVRRVRRGNISSELLMCGGGVRSILLMHLVARCVETIYVCIWRMFVVMSVVVTVWVSVGKFVVYRPLLALE